MEWVRQARRASWVTNKPYDVIVYGATEYVGKHVVEELARVAQLEYEDEANTIRWGIAGSDVDAMKKLLKDLQRDTGLQHDPNAILIANPEDESSLETVAAATKVLINCVIPYADHGEAVVQACLKNACNHVDLSTEPQFSEGIQLKHHQVAEDMGVHVVGGCGFSSLPADIATNYILKHYEGEVNSIEAYGTFKSYGIVPLHTSTLNAVLETVGNLKDMHDIRRQLFPKPLPQPRSTLSARSPVFYHENIKMWATPYSADEAVVMRSTHYRYKADGRYPVVFRSYFAFPSLIVILGFLYGFAFLLLMAFMPFTRAIFKRFPEMISSGYFSKEGASKKQLRKMRFDTTFIANGWPPDVDPRKSKPNKTMYIKMTGPDPTYHTSAITVVAAAITLLREKAECTGKGGVLTPAIAFANTDILQRLVDRGITLSIRKQDDKFQL
ncbi:unnamed protein product [Meganyctiphanes norvegica]|uniref:Saccharopine dehydrogenase NADP binding domain-containing protein n=1 Tax=Meganyctiphanes norvegica TaxID=48144 RepID=A0AAV2PKI2_MEGNR